ncbi:hypothetical protein ACFQJ5_07350 [Halomicroarcula sp. GCM10025324]|uniref:hypothetical protein n=1 Tax=Haloarcula TaxID=2237 RepID=UPI0023E8CA92|nr:hypothetical protein [Halomicroarcula sp. ZS-22-S1]
MPDPTEEALEEVSDDVSGDAEDLDDEAKELVDAILDGSGDTVRMAIQYSGDEYDLLFVREDVEAQFSEAEMAERVKTLMFKGLGDPVEESALFDFGHLDATVRWYDSVVVASFPVREWSGLVFTFDRVTDSLLDLADEHFGV